MTIRTPTGRRLSLAPLLASAMAAVLLVLSSSICDAQVVIPKKPDGFLYGGALPKRDSIVIDAFFDPVCPDSRDSWPALKQAVHFYAPRVSLSFHTFPLPYHDNAYVASRALHIADALNSSATYSLLEAFFLGQDKYYNDPTSRLTREHITADIARFTAGVLGPSWLPAIQEGFKDVKTSKATRTAFKYAASRGVTGTPIFFVNGFALPGGGTPANLTEWRDILDPLVD